MATTNPMYERFTNIYKLFYSEDSNPSLVLAHSGNRLFEAFNNSIYKDVSVSNSDETASAQCNSFFADNRKKALLADVGVGTIDQVVMSILPTKHQAIRMFGLSRNILIVDEVHTYDPYMNALLCKTLKLHASNGGSAILLSATLPINIKQQFVDSFRAGLGVDSVSLCDKSYPLFTYVDKSSVKEVPIVSGSKQKKIDIEFVSDLSKIEEKIIGAAHEGKCVCWIRNTVDDATEAYKRICDVIGFDKTYLSHAHFMMGDRQTIESDIIARFGKTSSIDVRRGRVVIATQILEQSLDIDFDYMVSDLAPIDVLIQRFGRLQRHERPEYGIRTPLFTIFSPEITDEPSDDWYRDFLPKAARYIYPCHGKLWLTARILNERKSILIPDDLRLLIEYVYGDQANDSIPESLKKHEDRANRIMDRQLSDACITSLNLTKGYSHASSGYTAKWYNNDKLAPTRYGEDTILVRFVKLECGKLTSFYPDEQHQWELSQASISTRQIASVQITDKNLNDAVTRLKAEMRDKGKFAEIIPLESEQAGEYKQADGVVIKNKYDVNVNLSYSKTVGFSIKR
jgi:CRISPR-associated endonuclease/helicase Cas3